MKIAMYHSTLPREDRKSGGVSVMVDRLANELAIDNDVTVYTLDERPEGRNYRVTQIFSGSSFLRDNPIARIIILPLLLNLISFKKFDVVNFHGDDWFYFRRTSPSIRVMHGSAKNESNSAGSLKRKLLQGFVYYLEMLSLRLATIGVAGGLDAKKVYGLKHILNYGVYFNHFYPDENFDAPTIFFIGTWEGRKRGKFLYNEFISKVLDKVPDARMLMVVNTPSDQQFHPAVKVFRNPSDAVVGELMRKSWVFAFPSTYEGFGIPYLEAMASKTAIVTSNNPGARYILNDGELGIISEDSTFADSIIFLIKDQEERAKLEDAGYKKAVGFSWQSIGRDYIKVYQHAIKEFKK